MLEKKTQPLEYLCVDGLSPKPHLHPEIEMVICKSGSCNVYINGKCYVLTENTAIIAFPHQVHFYDTTATGEFALFIFYPEITPLISDVFSTSVPDHPLIKLHQEQLLELDRFCSKYDRSRQYSATLLTGYINIIMNGILPSLKLLPISSERSLVDNIIRFCAKNFTEPISLDMLSRQFNASVSGISHVWSKVMKMSLPQYINWLRVSSACRLLASTDRTIIRIALDVGFTTLRNFNRTFVKIMRVTPTKYRKQLEQMPTR